MNWKELRKANGMTQGDVAKAVGVAVISYQLWERGHMNPSPENLEKLKKVLGVE